MKKKNRERWCSLCFPFLFWMLFHVPLSHRCASNLPVHLCLLQFSINSFVFPCMQLEISCKSRRIYACNPESVQIVLSDLCQFEFDLEISRKLSFWRLKFTRYRIEFILFRENSSFFFHPLPRKLDNRLITDMHVRNLNWDFFRKWSYDSLKFEKFKLSNRIDSIFEKL